MHFWREICKSMDTRPTYLAETVHRDASDLGYCKALVICVRGAWIDPNKDGMNRVRQVQ